MAVSILGNDALKASQQWQPKRLTVQLGAAALLVALADALFYGHRLGVSLALYLAVLAAAAMCLNKVRATTSTRWRAALLILIGLLPVIEDLNWLSAAIALLATATSARMFTEARDLHWREHLRAAAALPFSSMFRLFSDLSRASRFQNRRGQRIAILAGVLGWIVPLLFCAIFAALFFEANPLLENWLRQLDIGAALAQIVSIRTIFWAAMLLLIWPLLRIRSLHVRKRFAAPLAPIATNKLLASLNDRTVRRSLVLFNGLFALQTTMDIVFLWGGASLPDGMTHATYAHRGAYPLVVTALLAAGFVLVAMRPSESSERDPWVRPLILVWVVQNIVLVLSALLRLDLYVDAYSLTELRVAAFIWMLLVAVGLALILVQICLRRGIEWLVSANALVLALTLYAYSFVNTAAMIASFNFRHSFEMRGEGPPIDVRYLFSLGPSVIPALDYYAPRIAAAGHSGPQTGSTVGARSGRMIEARRVELARSHLEAQVGWRSWSFRGWRLSQYLANTPDDPFKATPESPTDLPEAK